MKNFYQILGLSEKATKSEIKLSYKKLAQANHPDKHTKDDALFGEIFKNIQEAYEILSNKKKRKDYDNLINSYGFVRNSEISEDKPVDLKVAVNNVEDVKAINDLMEYLDNFPNFTSKEKELEYWENVFTDWIFNIKSEIKVGEAIKVVAMVESIEGPDPILLLDGNRTTTYNISLLDHRGDKIECLAVPHESFKDEILSIIERKAYHVFCGTIVSIIGKYPVYKFYLQKILQTVTPEDLFRVKLDTSGKTAQKYLDIINSGGPRALLKTIRNTIINELGIKGIDTAEQLSKCIDFMILQGFSHGKDSKNSQRLHSLVIGSPGVGKKLLTLTAKILNPITEEISSVSGKISMAGMIGDVSIKKGKRISNPGYFAKASSGVLCVQDFHEVKGATRQQFLSLLSKVMEDGEVIDSTSARTTHEAITAIHLDTNLPSQVQMLEESNPLKDINIPTNILSRFDFIMNIPRDVDRQYEVIIEILSGKKTLESYSESELEKQWQRDIRRFTAHVRTAFHYVKIKEEISKYIVDKLKQIKKEAKETFKDQLLLADIITRLGLSIQKYVKAITSASLRVDATKEDVDYALEFIEEKLSYLSQIGKSKKTGVKKFTHKLKYAERMRLLRKIYEGEIIDSHSLSEVYKNHGISVSRTTRFRDLAQYNDSISHPKISFSKSTVAKIT